MTKIKMIILLILGLSLCSCSLPFQSENYPAWKTKDIIVTDNKGFVGLYIGDTAHTNDFDITVESYNKENDNLTATIKIVNKTDKKKNIKNSDFPLIWNLGTDNEGYNYPTDKDTSHIINSNEEIELTLEYTCSDNLPLALYYGEVYNDTNTGNSYYFYLK